MYTLAYSAGGEFTDGRTNARTSVRPPVGSIRGREGFRGEGRLWVGFAGVFGCLVESGQRAGVSRRHEEEGKAASLKKDGDPCSRCAVATQDWRRRDQSAFFGGGGRRRRRRVLYRFLSWNRHPYRCLPSLSSASAVSCSAVSSFLLVFPTPTSLFRPSFHPSTYLSL